MKNYLKSLMFAVVSTFILSSCDDVPSPYPMPINEGDNPAAIVEPAGEGTLESPYNVAYVRQICGDLEQTTDNSDKKLSPEIYVKGIVSKVETDGKNAWSSQYGNITYYISDDGKSANEFEVYRGLGLDGAKFASQDGVNVGDEVVVCGKVLNFKGTYEFDQGSKLVSINGSGDTPTPTPTPTGENLLVNGDFETWANDLPTHWKSASAAGNASLSQEADDVHGGDFAVAIAGVASANKRMAYEEITLKAGTYKFSLFAKSTTTDKSQTRVGYVTVVNGTADSQGYKYGDYVNLNNNDWTECSTTFTLTAQTTICLVVMNPKTNGEYSVAQTILVDDASLVTSDGGIADGDDSGDDNGDDGNIEHITVAEFLSKADTQTTYELTGTVQNIKNTTYGNFDLVEGDASIYIYGLLDLEGKTKNFSSLGISEGDKITITGKYVLYNNTTPEIKNAQFIRKEE